MNATEITAICSAIIAIVGFATAYLHAQTAHAKATLAINQSARALQQANKASWDAAGANETVYKHVNNHPTNPAAGAVTSQQDTPAPGQVTGSAPEVATGISSEKLSGGGL